MLNYTEIFAAFQLAVVAYVFRNILMQPDYILERYSDFLDDIERETKFGSFIAKPLGNCDLCFGGQLALWAYYLEVNQTYRPMWTSDVYAYIIFISMTILFTYIISLTIEKIK